MDSESILVVGSANMDLVVNADRFPLPGETIFGRHFEMFPGGKGANQAVCSAKLGGETYFIGKMGQDIFQSKLIANMKNEGVILDHILLDPIESTGIALITAIWRSSESQFMTGFWMSYSSRLGNGGISGIRFERHAKSIKTRKQDITLSLPFPVNLM